MRVRAVLIAASATAAFAAGGLVAAPTALADTSVNPVTVTTYNGGVQVGASLGDQTLAGVSADNSGVCAGLSYQTSTCVPGN